MASNSKKKLQRKSKVESYLSSGSSISSFQDTYSRDTNSIATQISDKIFIDKSQTPKNVSSTPVKPASISSTNHRISQAELQRRHEWLQKTRISGGNANSRTRISRQMRFPENLNGLFCAKFSSNGDSIVTSFGIGAIQIRNGETGELRVTLRSGLNTSVPVMCCRFNPIYQNIIYASSACGNIFLCMTDNNHFSRFIEEPKNEINAIDVSANGKYMVSGGKDAAVRLYDTETAKIIHIYKRNDADIIDEKFDKYHRMRIFAAKFYKTKPELIITGGWDDTVRLWDSRVATGSINVIKGPHICGDALDMKGNHIITGSWVVKGSLQLWDIRNCKLIETIVPVNRPTSINGEFLYAVQYFSGDPTGNYVLTGGSGTGALEVIDIKEKKVMASFEANKAIITLDSIGNSIVFGGMESIIHLANFN